MKRDSKTKQLIVEVVVGGFVVLIFAGLAYITILLSREAWFQKKYAVEVVFKDVMGLREGDNVVVRGMTVGKVKSLTLKPDGVHVVAALEMPLRLRRDYRMTVVATSILGGRYLQIDEGSADQPEVSLDTLFRGEEVHDLIADISDVAYALKQVMLEGGMLDNLKNTLTRLSQVADRLAAGEGTLGRLLSKDDTLYQDLAATVASLRNVAGRLERGEGSLGRLLDKDDQLYRDVAATAASLRNISARLEQGEGSLGLLLQDKGLYEDLKAAVNEVRAVVDDYRENAPVVTFSSIFLGAF